MEITSIATFVFRAIVPEFRNLIPEPHDREPITWKAIPFFAFAFARLFLLAYLARRSNTRIFRLLVLPTVIASALGASFRFVWTDPVLNVWNWGQCLWAEVVISKAVDFAFPKEGRLKVGETRPGELDKSLTSNGNGDVAEKSYRPIVIERPSYFRFIPSWLLDAIELFSNMRGIGWDFGRGVYIPKHTRPQDRRSFLYATFVSFLQNFLLLDALEWLLKLFPGVGDPHGGTMFYPHLPFPQRYAVSTFIQIISGTCLLTGFQMCYDLLTLIGVTFLYDPPSSWPPIFDNPWISDSLHTCWAKRWHQLLRRAFVVMGGYPGKFIAGNPGMLFGTFIASGLYHECSMYAMGQGLDYHAPLFFAAQALLLILERFWARATGHKVGGWPGRLWVYFVIIILGQPMVDSWHMRGLGGGMIIPPILSPVRMILFPSISGVAARWQH